MAMEALSANGISLGYQKADLKKTIIEDLSFSLEKGQLTCLLGRNGIGKSTLIKGLLGQNSLWKGEITIDRKSLHSYSKEDLAKKMAVVLTEPGIPGNLTAEQLIALGRIPHTAWHGRLRSKDYKAIDHAIESTKVSNFRKERLYELSDGQRQKVMIARALAQESEILILDEPTAHLDVIGRHEIMELLESIASDQEKALLVVTHNIELAIETAHEFWLLVAANQMITGKPEDLIISGEISSIISEENLEFDLQKGKIVFPSKRSDLSIQGSEPFIFWCRQALEKAGIHSLSTDIIVESEPFSLSYKGEKYPSLKALISAILEK